MKSKVKKLDGTAKELHISLPSEEVNKVINEVLEDIRKTAVIPGFRKGKAPIDIIDQRYREDAVKDMKQRLVPRAYQRALEANNIVPVSYPEVSDIVLDDAGALTFKATVDTHPEVKLKKYKGLKVAREKISVADKEVEDALSHIQNMHAEFADMDRPIKKGDFAVCDVEAFADDKPLSKKSENMWIEADKEASLLGMGEELCGLKKGEKKEIETTLPENYPDKNFAGKKALFKVEIKETKEKKLPPVDDELAKKVGKENMQQLREEIRSQLLERKEQNEKIKMMNQVMDQLLKNHSFDLPDSMVKRQLDVLVDKAENELAQKGVDKAAIDSRKDELKKQLAVEAENKVKLYFILSEISLKENVDVSEQEIDDRLKSIADSFKQPYEKVKEYYEEKDLIGGLREQLREDKTLEFLLQEANVTDK